MVDASAPFRLFATVLCEHLCLSFADVRFLVDGESILDDLRGELELEDGDLVVVCWAADFVSDLSR